MVANAQSGLVKIKKVTEDSKLTFLGTTEFHPDRGSLSDSEGFQRMEMTFSQREFEYKYPSGQNLLFFAWDTYHAMEQPTTQQAKAAWKSEQAIRVATSFRDVLANLSNIHLGPPTAKYKADYSYEGTPSVKTYHNGEWEVRWNRTDGKGHDFGSNLILIVLSEKYGLKGASVFLDDEYVELPGQYMPQDIAVAIAKRGAAQFGNTFRRYYGLSLIKQ